MIDINKIRKCSYLLPDPGGEVVRELVDELLQQQQRYSNLLDFVDDIRATARNRNPDGVTILDFMSVWNEQYENRIKQLQNEIERLRGTIDKAVDKLETYGDEANFDADGAYRILMDSLKEN